MLQSILLLMDHGGCSPIPLGTRPLSLLNPELQLGGCRRGWQWGSPRSLLPNPQSWGLWAASEPGKVTLACMFKTPLELWDVSTEFLIECLNTPEKSPAVRGGVSRWGWEPSPASAPLGPGDRKQQVGVSALCLCLQRKHSLEQRVPRGLEWGSWKDGERPCCKELWCLLQSSELKPLRLRAAKGMGKPGPALSCLEGLVGQRAWPGAELVSLGRQDRTPGSWAAWLTTCKPPAPPASPA